MHTPAQGVGEELNVNAKAWRAPHVTGLIPVCVCGGGRGEGVGGGGAVGACKEAQEKSRQDSIVTHNNPTPAMALVLAALPSAV